MKFVLDADQRLFAESLHKLLERSDVPSAIRAWSTGDHAPGRRLWKSLAEAGVFALAVPEEHGGAGVLPVELVTAFHELGRHAVPGPLVETVAAAALLTRIGGEQAALWLPRIAAGEAVFSVAAPYALDADMADRILMVEDGQAHLAETIVGTHTSLDPARRLFATLAVDALAPARESDLDLGVLACAAQQIGVGRRLLEVSVDYARARQQFGRPIGEFQAVKHHLADALVGLEFARPLVHAAALSHGTPDFARDVSAAKVAASDASYQVAKTALQIHGAIAYTDEYDPSLWIRKARALHTAWGSPSTHRARLIAAL